MDQLVLGVACLRANPLLSGAKDMYLTYDVTNLPAANWRVRR